jgi:3-oxoacyl-[acyl-carrier protein] reductase
LRPQRVTYRGGGPMTQTDRVAFVAGASGAIGAATARRFARDGYAVGMSYRSNLETVQQVAEEIESAGGTAMFFQATLENYDEVTAAVDGTVSAFGHLDAVVYAAGPYLPQRWVTELDPAQMSDIIHQDTAGAWNVFHASLLHLRATQGCVVSVSTPAVRRHVRKDLLSSAPKAAIEAMIRGIASEEGRYGVRANAVGVGTIDDGLFTKLVNDRSFGDDWLQANLNYIALGRLGAATDIAEAILFLASKERAGYISGQTLVVDGGFAL